MLLKSTCLVLAALSIADACDPAKSKTCEAHWTGANDDQAAVEDRCKALTAYAACTKIWSDSCTDVETKLGMATIGAGILTAADDAMRPVCAVVCSDQPVCAKFTTLTTTLTPWDSSASSGSDVTSLDSSYSSSFKEDSSGDSSGSNASSGSTGSGSSGSYLLTWQWLLLIALCCCCVGGGAGAAMGKKPKKKKPTPKPVPAPEPEPVVPVLEPLMMPIAPAVEYIPTVMPTTTAYAAPVSYAAAPATTAYAAAPVSYAAAPAYSTGYAMPAYSGGAVV